MKEIAIKAIYAILGLNAGSGITYVDDKVYVISDNANVLYEYQIQNQQTIYHSLDNNPINHQLNKAEKYDLEAITKVDDQLFIIGSGSQANRNTAFNYNLNTQKTDTLSLQYLYETLQDFSEIPEKELNIEGVVKYKDDYIFLNRGNGPSQKNTLFVVQGKNLVDEFNTFYYEFDLPTLNNVPTGFSDAVVVNNHMFFIATAEDTSNVIDDGEIKGSLIGAIDLKKMKLLFTEVISNNQKFEGITLKSIDKKNVEFLLVEDNDDANVTESKIYSLTAKLKRKP